MPITNIRGRQILNGDVFRDDLNITNAGQAVIRRILAGTGISLTSTGVDTGTGDVTINISTVPVANGGTGVSTANANTFFAAPNGSSGAPSFRAIVASDIPILNQNTTGNAATATTATTWAGAGTYGGGYSSGTIGFFMVYNNTNSRWEAYTASALGSSFLGLGSYAYRSSGLAELSGATFTGAISGTSATFSSSVTAVSATLSGNLTQNSSTDDNIYSVINRQGSSSSLYDAAILLRTSGTNNWALGLLGNALGSTTDFAIRNLGNSTTPLRINYSTGAATFSSTVTATSFIRSGGMSSQFLMGDGSIKTLSSNWSSEGSIGMTVGMLGWKAYGNGHVIFDASAGTAPNGVSINNTNPAVPWTGTYPVLMGWNGSTTYGVRVDSARVADVLVSMNISQFTNNSGYLTAESDTLQTVTNRGSATTNRLVVQRSTSSTSWTEMQFEVQTVGTGVAGISFHRAGHTAVALYHDGTSLKIDGNQIVTNTTATTWGINISGNANNITQYTINQNLGTSSAPTFADVYTNGWFRNYNNHGLYNQTHGNHFYATGNSDWNIAGDNPTSSALYFRRNGYGGTLSGAVYGDTGGFGLLDNNGNWSLQIIHSTKYLRVYNWLEVNGSTGIYWPNFYGLHLSPNQNSSYGPLQLLGSKNSYDGIYSHFSGVNGFMFDGAGNGGAYREANGRWYWYYHLANDCMGIGTSSTSSSYGLWVNKGIYTGGNLVSAGNLVVANESPTIYLQDSNHRSAMIHVNSNAFYVLRGSGVNSTSWSTFNGYWPLEINLENNNATFGGSITAVGGGFNSDIKDKTNIIRESIKGIESLRGASYLRISTGLREYGYIAQEVQAILPEAVYENKGGLALSYHMVNAARIDYVQDELTILKMRVKELENQVINLGGRI